MARGHTSWRCRSGRRLALAGALGVGFGALLVPGVAAAAPGDVLVTDLSAFGGPGGVIGVDPASGARTTVSANGAPAGGPDFDEPGGVALEADGDILVADPGDVFGGTPRVIRVDAASGTRTTVSANGAPAGGPDFVQPVGVALDADGDILVADASALGGTGGVIRVDPTSGARTAVSANGAPAGGPDFAIPVGVALEADGDILVADVDAFGGTGGVIRVDPASGTRTTLSANGAPAGGPDFAAPLGVAVEADGDILVADSDALGGTGGVIRVDPASGARTAVSANGAPPGGPDFADPLGVAVEPAPPSPQQPPPDRPPPDRPPPDQPPGGGAGPVGPAQPGCPLAGSVIVGSSGDDERSGGALSDIIFGALGDDLLRGLGGADCLYGQQGADRLLGGRGRDRLFGGPGPDRLRGGAGSDRLRDSRGRDRLAGGASRDRLRAGPGSDRLSGGPGGDRINPGDGRDRVAAGPGNDRVLARGSASDAIDCGPGQGDVAIVDPLDDTRRCEQVRLP